MTDTITSFIRPTALSDMTRLSVPYVIFKHSRDCGQSLDVVEDCARLLGMVPVYQVTVQDSPALSQKIAAYFDIQHETPQVLLIQKDRVLYVASHRDISIDAVCAIIDR